MCLSKLTLYFRKGKGARDRMCSPQAGQASPLPPRFVRCEAPYCMCPYATVLIASLPKPLALLSSSPSGTNALRFILRLSRRLRFRATHKLVKDESEVEAGFDTDCQRPCLFRHATNRWMAMLHSFRPSVRITCPSTSLNLRTGIARLRSLSEPTDWTLLPVTRLP